MTEAAAVKPKKRPLMVRIPANFVAAVLKGHSGLGIAFAAAIYLVCLSGSITVFYEDITRWENASAPYVESVSPQAAQNAIKQAADRAGDGLEHINLFMPDATAPLFRVSVDLADGEPSRTWFADENGDIQIIARYNLSTFFYELHALLHLPSTFGGFIVGMTGVALLSSLFSGILAHPRIFRDAFHLRLGGSKRLQEADLHNRISVWGLPFHFIVSLTGAFLGLVTITVGVLGMAMFNGDTDKIYELFLAPEQPDNPAPAPLFNAQPLFAQLPDVGEIERVTLEHPKEQGGYVMFQLKDETLLAGVSSFGYNRAGEQVFSQTPEDLNVGEQVIGAISPLHYGWFGGNLVKIVYGILGLGLTYLAVGGINIWLARRRDKGRPTPFWEGIWAAVVWGQPVALSACAALAVMAAGASVDWLLALWCGISLTLLAGTAVLSADGIKRWSKLVAGAVLIVLSLWHAAFIAIGSDHAAVWVVDLTLLAIGLFFCVLALRSVRGGDVTQKS